MWKLRLTPSNQWLLNTSSSKLFSVISQSITMCPLLLLFQVSPGAIDNLKVCVGEGRYTILGLEERDWFRITLFNAKSSTNNISATRELVWNVSIWAWFHTDLLNQKLWRRGPRICVLTRAPGDSDVSQLWEPLVQSYQHPPTLISDERCDHCQSLVLWHLAHCMGDWSGLLCSWPPLCSFCSLLSLTRVPALYPSELAAVLHAVFSSFLLYSLCSMLKMEFLWRVKVWKRNIPGIC